jgi:hypothetical protein
MCTILLVAAHVSRADQRSAGVSIEGGYSRFSMAGLPETPPQQVFTFPLADASPIGRTSAHFFGERIEGAGGLVMTMILIALATLISQDLTCIGAGLMAAGGCAEP